MERSGERTALAGVLLSVAAAIVAATGWPDDATSAMLHVWAAGTSALVAIRLYFARRAREEAEERRLTTTGVAGSLFGAGVAEGDTGFFARSAASFERWVVPWAAPVLGTIALTAAIRSWTRLKSEPVTEEVVAALGLSARHGVTAFLLLVAARYQLSASRQAGLFLLRGVGAALGAAAFGSAFAAAAALGQWAGIEWANAIGRRALAVWAGVLGAEQYIRALLELYRPRRADEPPAAPYESALTVRLLEPASWWRVAAESVDYQFGFPFSRTQMAQRVVRVLWPFLGVQAAVLYGWTCVAILKSDEEGVRERMGRPVEGPEGRVGPGWHWTWPWPFERIRRAPVRRALRLTVGFEGDEEVLPELLWTRPHYRREDLFLSAVRVESWGTKSTVLPVSVVSVNVPVEYRITNLLQYVYRATDAVAVLRAAVHRSLVAELAGRDLWEVLGPGQAEFGRSLAERIRRDVDRWNIGVEVTLVGLQGVHPPVEVAEAFEEVVAAIEQREAAILKARGHIARIEADAAARAFARRIAAEAARDRIATVAVAEAGRFLARRLAADVSPAVYRGRASLDAVQAALERPRLYLIATAVDREVLQFNLEPKVSSVLWDIGVLTNRAAVNPMSRDQESVR